AVGEFADVDGKDGAAGCLDTRDNLGLDAERADESIEVGDNDHISLASLHEFDGPAEARPFLEWRPARNVELLDRVNELEPVTLARRTDTLGLLGWTDELLAAAIADSRDTDDAYGAL